MAAHFEIIKVGNKIDVYTKEDPGLPYISKIVNILDAKQQVISMYIPVLAGKNLNMTNRDDYTAVVSVNSSLLSFPCQFLGYLREEFNYFITAKLVGEGDKMQRRNFFRFTSLLAMKFSVLDFEDNEAARVLHNSGYAAINDAIVRDIGGGGMCFISNADFDTKFFIQCTIMLGTTALRVKCHVLDKQFMPSARVKFMYRATFLDISQQTQEEIVSYIFAEQRKKRKTTAH